jgi:hypothetical protein
MRWEIGRRWAYQAGLYARIRRFIWRGWRVIAEMLYLDYKRRNGAD